MRTWLLCGLLAWYGWLNVSAIAAWHSEPALWAHAYVVAPTAPRTAINHAKHLMAAGDEAAARAVIAAKAARR